MSQARNPAHVYNTYTSTKSLRKNVYNIVTLRILMSQEDMKTDLEHNQEKKAAIRTLDYFYYRNELYCMITKQCGCGCGYLKRTLFLVHSKYCYEYMPEPQATLIIHYFLKKEMAEENK